MRRECGLRRKNFRDDGGKKEEGSDGRRSGAATHQWYLFIVSGCQHGGRVLV